MNGAGLIRFARCDVVLSLAAGRDPQPGAGVNAVAAESPVHLRRHPDPSLLSIYPGVEGFRLVTEVVVEDHFLPAGGEGRKQLLYLLAQGQPALVVVASPESKHGIGWPVEPPGFQIRVCWLFSLGFLALIHCFAFLLLFDLCLGGRLDAIGQGHLGGHPWHPQCLARGELFPGLH